MAHFFIKMNQFADKSCSVVVSLAVTGVNLYFFDPHCNTIAVPMFTTACCATAAISKALKRVVNQSRPSGAPKLSPGMPSNHATALSFLSIAVCTGLWRSYQTSSSFVEGAAVPGSLLATQAGIVAYGLYASGLRVACGHHTIPQVLVGYTFGASCAAACLGANFVGYTGNRAGGRVDELPVYIKTGLLAFSMLSCALALRSILRGAPIFARKSTSLTHTHTHTQT